jgi:hypothetical protein
VYVLTFSAFFFFSIKKLQAHVQACNHPYTTKITVSYFYFSWSELLVP